jgi:membrane protein YdbS with pleckstrin-like domain
MHCHQCGQDVPAESVFCSHCGTRLADGADEAEVENNSPAGAERLRPGKRNSDSGKSPSEQELWSGSYSPKAMIGSFAAAGVVTIVGLALAALSGPPGWLIWGIAAAVIWGGLLLLLAYRRLTVRYRLTTYRFFHELGLLSRVGNRIEVIDIDDVTVQQGLVERMFGVGTITIQSSDRSDPELHLPGIEDARQVADLIDGTRRAERHRRSLHIESI